MSSVSDRSFFVSYVPATGATSVLERLGEYDSLSSATALTVPNGSLHLLASKTEYRPFAKCAASEIVELQIGRDMINFSHSRSPETVGSEERSCYKHEPLLAFY